MLTHFVQIDLLCETLDWSKMYHWQCLYNTKKIVIINCVQNGKMDWWRSTTQKAQNSRHKIRHSHSNARYTNSDMLNFLYFPHWRGCMCIYCPYSNSFAVFFSIILFCLFCLFVCLQDSFTIRVDLIDNRRSECERKLFRSF